MPVQAPAEEGMLRGDPGQRLSQVPRCGRGLGLPSQGAGADIQDLSHPPLGPGCELVLTAQLSVPTLSWRVLTHPAWAGCCKDGLHQISASKRLSMVPAWRRRSAQSMQGSLPLRVITSTSLRNISQTLPKPLLMLTLAELTLSC